MIYHTEWKERGLKGLWVEAATSGSALLALSATNVGFFVVLLSWFACSVLNRAFFGDLGEVFFPEEEDERKAWAKIFRMLNPKVLYGNEQQVMVLSRLKWLINPASWTLSLLDFLEWGLLKADSFLRQKRVHNKIDLGFLILVRFTQTVLRGLSLLLRVAENLFSLPYWFGYGLSYVFGFRPPRGDEMVGWDRSVARVREAQAQDEANEAQPLISPPPNPMHAAGLPVYKQIMVEGEALLELKEAQPPPGPYLRLNELVNYYYTQLEKNQQGYEQVEIKYKGQIFLYQRQPLVCEVRGFLLRAEDWSTPGQINAWNKKHEDGHTQLGIGYIEKTRKENRSNMEKMAADQAKLVADRALDQAKLVADRALDQAKLAEKIALDQAKLAEKNASEKVKTAKSREQEANDKAEDLTEEDLLPSMRRFLQRELERARAAADEAKGEAERAQQEAEEARQVAKQAQEAADKVIRDFERRYPSERVEKVRRGSGPEFFSHNESSGRKPSAEAEKDEKEEEHSDSEKQAHAPG